MSLKLGNTPIAGISTHTISNAHTLFDFKWSDHEIDDMSWSRADTFSWQSGDTYTSAYNHLVQDIQGKTAETDTINGIIITFYRATDGHKICLADQESVLLNLYNTVGVAWYYLLDTANTQFKFPRTKYGFEGLRSYVGSMIRESLPTPSHTHTRGDMNITGTWAPAGLDTAYNTTPTGAFSNSTRAGNGYLGHNSKSGNTPYVNFNASNNWTGSTSQPNGLPSVYQSDAPVQERATQMYLYFYVGDYSQTAIEQTAGLNAELFNNKLDLNASNLSTQGMSYIAGMGMPSNKYINLTLGASGSTYTAPANGYYNIARVVTAQGQYVDLVNNTTGYFVSLQKDTSGMIRLGIPVRKGDVLQINYTAAGGSYDFFRFFYAQGSESEGA